MQVEIGKCPCIFLKDNFLVSTIKKNVKEIVNSFIGSKKPYLKIIPHVHVQYPYGATVKSAITLNSGKKLLHESDTTERLGKRTYFFFHVNTRNLSPVLVCNRACDYERTIQLFLLLLFFLWVGDEKVLKSFFRCLKISFYSYFQEARNKQMQERKKEKDRDREQYSRFVNGALA